jgi:hypothetical protein
MKAFFALSFDPDVKAEPPQYHTHFTDSDIRLDKSNTNNDTVV